MLYVDVVIDFWCYELNLFLKKLFVIQKRSRIRNNVENFYGVCSLLKQNNAFVNLRDKIEEKRDGVVNIWD